MFDVPLERNLIHPIPAHIADGVKLVVLRDLPSGVKCRGMVATRDFSPGDVLVKEPPYAYAVSEGEAENICSAEMRELTSEQASLCGGCRLVRYSSRAAQKLDWAAGHKFECKALQAGPWGPDKRIQSLPATMVRLAARCLWRRQAELNSTGSPIEFWQSFDSIATLLEHISEGSSSYKMPFAAISSRIKSFIQLSGGASDVAELDYDSCMLLVGKLAANCLNISLDEGTSVGLGIYPLSAMVNHSHTPNVAQMFRRGVLHLRAVRPIAAGEEIHITYCGLEQPSFQSRQELLSSFFFDACPHLPPTDDMPAVRTHRFDTTMYAHILSPDVSSKLAANDKDAALCAVSQAPQQGEARFCWVSVVTSDTREASELGSLFSEAPEPGRENKISEEAVAGICDKGWCPAHALSALDPSAPTPLWHEQVLEEGWSVHVRLFGDWATCMHGDEDTSWLEVASAAAFAQVGMMWAREMLHTGRAALGRSLLTCVEAAGVSGGLADTHEVLIEARSELMKLSVSESNQLAGLSGAGHATKAKEHMRQALEYGLKTVAGKEKVYPPAWYDLGATYRTLGDGAVAKGCPAEALKYWTKAHASLRTLLGPVAEVQRLKGRLMYHGEGKQDGSKMAEAIALMKSM